MTKSYAQPDDYTIPHQELVEKLIDDRAATKPAGALPTIADPATPGASYVQAEAKATRDALVSVLGVLRGAGLIA